MYISHNISNDKLASFKVQPKYKQTYKPIKIIHFTSTSRLTHNNKIWTFRSSGSRCILAKNAGYKLYPNFPAILPICFMWTCYVADFQKMTPAALHASKSSSFRRLKVKGTTSRYNAQVFFEPDYQCWISLQLIFLELVVHLICQDSLQDTDFNTLLFLNKLSLSTPSF